jgi:hypothetical protein
MESQRGIVMGAPTNQFRWIAASGRVLSLAVGVFIVACDTPSSPKMEPYIPEPPTAWIVRTWNSGVELRWESGVRETKFDIYRAFWDEPLRLVAWDVTDNYYEDSSLLFGHLYYYSVVAHAGDEESALSPPIGTRPHTAPEWIRIDRPRQADADTVYFRLVEPHRCAVALVVTNVDAADIAVQVPATGDLSRPRVVAFSYGLFPESGIAGVPIWIGEHGWYDALPENPSNYHWGPERSIVHNDYFLVRLRSGGFVKMWVVSGSEASALSWDADNNESYLEFAWDYTPLDRLVF